MVRKKSNKLSRKKSIARSRRNVGRKGSIAQQKRNSSRKKSVRRVRSRSKFGMNDSRVSPYFKATTKSGSILMPDIRNLTNLPEDVLYNISKSLNPVDRARLASTSKSTRSIKSSIHQAPMENIEINTVKKLKEHFNYLKYLMGENIPIQKMHIDIKYMVNVADVLDNWFTDVLNVIGEKNFKKINFHIEELYITEKYKNSFEYEKYKNIKIYTIYMVNIVTPNNINLLNGLEHMNIERVIYVNDKRVEDTDICKYLCKVKTVSMNHAEFLPESAIDFSYFGNKYSKTKNISIHNFNPNTLEYFSGMNCVYVSEKGENVVIENLHNVKYVLTHCKEEVIIRNSSNINNIIMCVSDRGREVFPLFDLNPVNVADNIHILNPVNAFQNRMVSYLVKNGVNVIPEQSPCMHPQFELFRRFK